MTVSIIIPTYNRSGQVCEAIDSVLSQDYADKELIVVDDGSTDDTGDILKKYDGSLKYICIQHGGVSRARNVGIEASKGELIAFLDSDDLWKDGKLAYQADYFQEHPEISVCQTEETWVRGGVRVNPKKNHRKYSGWIFEKCIPLCIISPSAVMLRREVFDRVGSFDVAMPVCEDYDLWLRVALKYQVVTLPEPMIVKRGGHTDQLSGQWGQDVWRIYALRKILETGSLTPEQVRLVDSDIQRRSTIVFRGAVKRGNTELAEKFRNFT